MFKVSDRPVHQAVFIGKLSEIYLKLQTKRHSFITTLYYDNR